MSTQEFENEMHECKLRLGQLIKECHGTMSQRKLAAQVGLVPSHLKSIEDGVHVQRIKKVAAATLLSASTTLGVLKVRKTEESVHFHKFANLFSLPERASACQYSTSSVNMPYDNRRLDVVE